MPGWSRSAPTPPRRSRTPLRAWRPGATDRDVMAAVAAGCEAAGIVPVCLIVGGDDRLARFRHPLA